MRRKSHWPSFAIVAVHSFREPKAALIPRQRARSFAGRVALRCWLDHRFAGVLSSRSPFAQFFEISAPVRELKNLAISADAPTGRKNVHTVVCETEPIAIDGLRVLLAEDGGFRLADAHASLPETMAAVSSLAPSVFLV